MPKFEAVFRDSELDRVGDPLLIEAENIAKAMVKASELIPTIQGNAMIVEANVEELNPNEA